MKNASAKNTVAALSIAAMALALSVGAFAGTANAQLWTDNGGYGGFGDVDTYDEYFTPYGSDTYDEYFSPSSYDTYDEYFTPYSTDTYDEYFTPYGTDTYDEYFRPYSSPSYGSSYGSSATYSSGYIPTYAAQYIPTYAMQYIPPSVLPPSVQRAPTFTTTSAPTNNTNTNTNTNTSVNTNTNTPTAVATNGPITNTNTFNPVINVQAGNPQHLAAVAAVLAPSCTIYASNAYSSGYYNQPITLTWSSTNATRGYISPNVGNVETHGSRTVYPTGYTTYTLTVYGSGGSAACQTTANYASAYVAPAPVYAAAPAAPYVSLSQIPYTGFDFGPVGNAMYWAALLAIAAAAAYLFVYYLPGRRSFAFANFSGGRKNSAFDPVKDDKSSHGERNTDLETVFRSSIVPATSLETDAISATVVDLPKIESHRLTTDTMIVDRTSDAPRIVIARN